MDKWDNLSNIVSAITYRKSTLYKFTIWSRNAWLIYKNSSKLVKQLMRNFSQIHEQRKNIVLQTFDSINETPNRGPHFGVIRQMGKTYLHEKEQ